ncbi:MAG TPA: NAD(P)-dependent oxidoreductase [Acidimicrobiales bacterium]|jgi:3-hydroxyisobutyrate dehydrogenase|nr:NAD(P)-dependent oxidoreductase [Acidimicrobiales bacterium]
MQAQTQLKLSHRDIRAEGFGFPVTRRSPHRSTLEVSVVGAGTMGSAMAARLLRQRMHIAVWSRHPESTGNLVERGANAFADVTEAVATADIVITMLPNAEATRAVMLRAGGLERLRPHATWAQMGTIGVAETEQLEVDVRRLRPDVTFVDAPVSGSRVPAEDGKLLILASGPATAEATLQPVFSALGRSTLWLGPVGAGSRMKLVLNTWLAFQTESAAETAALAETFGLSKVDLVRALKGNPLASDYALAQLDRMLEHDYHADFALDLALKDLDLVTSEASGAAPIAGNIAARWRGLVQEGWSGLDVSAARIGLGPGSDRDGGGSER